MNLPQALPQVNVIAARFSTKDGYHLTVESPVGNVELDVNENIYRRALVDSMITQDFEELDRWLDERYSEVIEMHEAEFGDWPALPSDYLLEDMADFHAEMARSNGFVLGMSAPKQDNALAKAAKAADYETVDEFLSDAAWELTYKLQSTGDHVDYETARQWVVDSEGDVDNALSIILEDMDFSDPTQEPHFSPSFLNS